MAHRRAPPPAGLTAKDYKVFFHYLRLLHRELMFGRRQILVVIQRMFDPYEDPDLDTQLTWPIEDQVHEQFDLNAREDIDEDGWLKALPNALSSINGIINSEQQQPGSHGPVQLPPHQRKAKYLEVAVAGLDHLFDVMDQVIDKYEYYKTRIQTSVSKLEDGSPERNTKQAALDILSDELDGLWAHVNSVLDWRNRLLDLADYLFFGLFWRFDQTEAHRILSRVYYRLYSTPDRVPMKEFVTVAYRFVGLFSEFGKPKDWFPPLEGVVLIRGRLGVLKQRIAERDGEAPEEDEGDEDAATPEDEGVNRGQTFPILNSTTLRFFHRVHEEMIFGRRQILAVIQFMFGDFKRRMPLQFQQFAWPIEVDGRRFDSPEFNEGLSLVDWYNGVLKAYFIIIDRINVELGQTAAEQLTPDQQRGKLIEVAVTGLDYLYGLSESNGPQQFDWYRDECQKFLSYLRDDQERQDKLEVLDNFLQQVAAFWDKIKIVAFEHRSWLLQRAEDLYWQRGEVDLEEVHRVLSDIYFKMHELWDQVPMKEFVEVASEIFGWNWKFDLTVRQNLDDTGHLTWFKRLANVVVINGKLGVLSGRAQRR